MSESNTFLEVKKSVEEWWSTLQFERKCSSTNVVSKIVNNSSEDIQVKVQELISNEIKTAINACYESVDFNNMQNACNAINGCFDNFVHAVDGVRLSFNELISFIDFGLGQCQQKLFENNGPKNHMLKVLELLHSFSRILILILKLNRTQNIGKKTQSTSSVVILKCTDINPELQNKMVSLTLKIGEFLTLDEVLIDTKNNMAMAGLLIREILIPNEDKLKEYHSSFIRTIPNTLEEEHYKENISKFLLSNAIINTWSVNIIDPDSAYVYLKFFISLCEKYSSETPIILNTSRTLLLLVRHDCFKQFVFTTEKYKLEKAMVMLCSCIFMLLEHPVACVRHSAKDFLQVLAAYSSLVPILIDLVFKLPNDKRCYFISIGALANEIGSRLLIEKNNNLPQQLLSAISDPTIVSHVAFALENMILRDSLAENNFCKWCELWIVPLLISLVNVLPIVGADIDKVLEKTFKKYPISVIYIVDKWEHPTSGEELRYVITALKICHKHGFKLRRNSSLNSFRNLSQDNTSESSLSESDIDSERKWKNLISEKLLEHCLHQRDDDIRISAFSLLIEAHKSTEPYSEVDIRLIKYFLKYNLNNQQPSTRQKIMGLIRKMLVRFSESKAVFERPSKHQLEMNERNENMILYKKFLDSLVEFCFDNIFIGCNFNRLNTVLNILLLCFENIRDMKFEPSKCNYYWKKLLIALGSSYEENKSLAVVLSTKLDFSYIEPHKLSSLKSLYEKAFNLCVHMEPPDVLTGAYLLLSLIKMPSSLEVLRTFFTQKHNVNDVSYICVQILTEKLKDQVELAKLDLMTAATYSPMYGTLFAIRLVFNTVGFSDENLSQSLLTEWGKILNELVDISIEMAHLVGCVVNSSSPEGHLPMDFQTSFDPLLTLHDDSKKPTELESDTEKLPRAFKRVNKFFCKFTEFEKSITDCEFDAYETFRQFNCLLKECDLLFIHLRNLSISRPEDWQMRSKLVEQLMVIKCKIEHRMDRLNKTNNFVDWPPTAQVLLLCAWRTIKEATLYLGDFVSKLPIEIEMELGLLTKDTILRIGKELKILLCEIKHRGAFEHAYIGFTQLVNALWKCSDKDLSDLPKKWLEEVIEQLESPSGSQKVKWCSTRRSAGLPFMVQAIVCSEIISVKSSPPISLHNTMKSLLRITEEGVPNNPESKIHALNILRALFKHAQLGEHIASYVSRALMTAIRGSRADTWSVRNSSSLLFSSLIIRVFGVARSRDEISKKNRMTSRTFFQRYSDLYDFLISEMAFVYSTKNYVEGVEPKPSLYLVLLILARLYPPPTEDPENVNLLEFLPYINMSRKNPALKIRELGARALVPLITLDKLVDELDDRFLILSFQNEITENERHGILLQVKALLKESVGVLENVRQTKFEEKAKSWIGKTKWMFDLKPENIQKRSLVNVSTYIQVLHIMMKNYPALRGNVYDSLLTSSPFISELSISKSEEYKVLPGIYLFLENFYYLKTDILVCSYFACKDSISLERFYNLFLFMLNNDISDIQCIPLRILFVILRDSTENNVADDEFQGVAAPISNLLSFQSEENIKKLRHLLLSHEKIIKFITTVLENPNCEYFKSKVSHRMWLNVVSNLVVNNIVPISHLDQGVGNSLNISFAKPLLKSGDKELSTNSLICYLIYLMEEIEIYEDPPMGMEKSQELFDILNEFSSPDLDVKERMAVAKIMNRCCKILINKNLVKDPIIMNIWMIPILLLADEDQSVRVVASELVYKLQNHVAESIPSDLLLIKSEALNWPNLPLVSLKAQECLLDSYINILGKSKIFYLIVQMVVMLLSSLYDSVNVDEFSRVEFGVFEKGNPNPFCEDLGLSSLIFEKFLELRSIIDLDEILRTPMDMSMITFISERFNLSGSSPDTLMELVETVTTKIEFNEKINIKLSLAQRLNKNLGND